MKYAALIVLALGLLLPTTASAKEPPSFAIWVAKWKAKTDAPLDKLQDGCFALYGQTADRKIGECFVKGSRRILRQYQPLWETAVAKISVGQTPACRKAIHTYWLASRKAQAASLIYLDSHPHTSITDVASDLKDDPYATLKSQTDNAKRSAIKVCG